MVLSKTHNFCRNEKTVPTDERELDAVQSELLNEQKTQKSGSSNYAVCEHMRTSATNLGENDSPGREARSEHARIPKKIFAEVAMSELKLC